MGKATVAGSTMSKLDKYDGNVENQSKGKRDMIFFSRRKNHELPWNYKLIKFALIAISGVILIFGLAVMISAAYISTTSAFKIAGMRVAIGLSVIGALIFLMALFGGCGSIAENRFVLIVFIIYTATLFLIQIIITAWTFAQRNQLESLLSTGWTKALDEEKQAVQTTFTCCGFSSLTDKAVPPCPTGSTEGCFAAIKDKISHDWKWLSAAAVIICLLQIVALGLAYILNKGIKKAVASNTINRAAR